MSKKRRKPKLDLETLIPLLIGVWRQYQKIGGPKETLQTREFRSVVEEVRALQNGLYVDKTLLGTNLFAKRSTLGAYLLYHWLIHYQEGMSLLGELPEAPKRVLDLCAGPAPFAFAALQHGATDVVATDQNEEALKLGGKICGKYGHPITFRKWDCLSEDPPFEGEFDLIILGHCIEHLFPCTLSGWREYQATFMENVFTLLKPNGYVLIVENSYLPTNTRLLKLRDHLVKSGVPIQAPCVWQGECPALQTKNSPCYAQRDFEKPYHLKEIQRAAQINLSSLKMSYLLTRHPEAKWPTLPLQPVHRVISPPVESFQGQCYHLCGTEGKKRLESSFTDHPKESRAFEYLRRGDLIHVEDAATRNAWLKVTPETKIQVVAACGKPVIKPS